MTNVTLMKQLNLRANLDLIHSSQDNQAELPRFRIVAYTGVPMRLAGFSSPLVIDLQGIDLSQQIKPVLLGHDTRIESILGQTTSIAIENNQLVVYGSLLSSSDRAKLVLDLARRGFRWQASIGAFVEEAETIAEGQSVIVNGQERKGPIEVARKTYLGEISFVPLGADDNTSAIFLGQSTNQAVSEANTMHSEPKHVDEAQEVRKNVASELKRIAEIRKICSGQHDDIEIKAIEEGWSPQRTELEVLRASRPVLPTIKREQRHTNEIIEAALCLSAGVSEKSLVRWYGDKIVEQAQSREYRGLGLHELFHLVASHGGRHLRPGRLNDDAIREVFDVDLRLKAQAGFSTLSLSGILSNVANKALLESFTAVEAVAPRIAAATDVNDFKQVTRYRLTGIGRFEKVPPGGELKSASLEEEGYTNQLDTYGTILTLTRQMIINDDLGAFLQIPRILGRQAALAIERAVFSLLLSNPNGFFSAAHGNLLTGAGSALSISGLTAAERLFAEQKDLNGDPVLISPAFLLVPPALKVTAQQLMTETRVVAGGSEPVPASNPHAGKWIPLMSPYLSAPNMQGSSSTAWYLFANPADVAAVEIAYLRGQRTPVIESGETDFDTLGMRWRAYFDFGVALQDYRAAVKATGV